MSPRDGVDEYALQVVAYLNQFIEFLPTIFLRRRGYQQVPRDVAHVASRPPILEHPAEVDVCDGYLCTCFAEEDVGEGDLAIDGALVPLQAIDQVLHVLETAEALFVRRIKLPA